MHYYYQTRNSTYIVDTRRTRFRQLGKRAWTSFKLQMWSGVGLPITFTLGDQVMRTSPVQRCLRVVK